jgi:hypothetical protein
LHVMSAARRSRRKITAERLVGAARNGQTDGVWTAEDPRNSALDKFGMGGVACERLGSGR